VQTLRAACYHRRTTALLLRVLAVSPRSIVIYEQLRGVPSVVIFELTIVFRRMEVPFLSSRRLAKEMNDRHHSSVE
jgi:hypothetical protein